MIISKVFYDPKLPPINVCVNTDIKFKDFLQEGNINNSFL